MKKALLTGGIWLMLTVWLMGCFAVSAAPIDPAKPSSLTLYYTHGETAFEGVRICTYRVADVAPDGTYTLCAPFADYPVNIYGITSGTEWKTLSSTLAAYAAADNLSPTCTAVTDETGRVAFPDILPGMYLTLAVRVETAEATTLFESFLTVVPHPAEDGAHNYDVTAYPKCEAHTPSPKELEYKVVKQWKDEGYTQKRPAYVQVDILKDGMVTYTERLTAANNWAFRWTAPDDGGKWQAVERDVPAPYTVTVTDEGHTILLTNVYDTGFIPPPQTGDTTVLWPYVLVMCLSGGILLLFATWRKRAEE